jgi:hypothetical protein
MRYVPLQKTGTSTSFDSRQGRPGPGSLSDSACAPMLLWPVPEEKAEQHFQVTPPSGPTAPPSKVDFLLPVRPADIF